MKRAARNGVAENLQDARALARMLRVLAEMKKPTIARVQGAALGGGTGLTAACDIAVASTQAVFATSEVKFGIIPSAISPYVVRAIGARQSYRYFQSAERISAERAREIGLVHKVFASENFHASVDQEIAAAARDLAEYQRLTADGKLAEAGERLQSVKSRLERLARQPK